MATTTLAPPRRMTVEEFLAMPHDGVRRWLVNGVVREEENGMTYRNRFHSSVMVEVATALNNWRRERTGQSGRVYCGEAGIRFPTNPDSIYGLDVVYVSEDVVANLSDETTILEGVPTLIAEILSPSTTEETTNEKLAVYRDAGVPLVWVLNPYQETVLVYRHGQRPTMVNADQDLIGDPELPGFRVPVRQLFE